LYVALSIGLWGTAAYAVQQHIVNALLQPAHNQQFIYTSVGGGIDFLFRVCIYTGIACSIPVIVFQILKYLEPLIKKDAIRFIAWGSVASGVLAAAGMIFGYYIGLPAALHFLLHQFTTNQIHPLLTIQSYMGFVTLYMLGSALLFQVPLLLILINRIKPLRPKKLLGLERWVILIAFVLGGIMNPSPRIQDQILLAGPMIIAYHVGVGIVWFANRRSRRPKRVISMREKDIEARVARYEQFQAAQALLQKRNPTTASPVAPVQSPATIVRPAARSVPVQARATTPMTAERVRPRYADGFTPRRNPRSFGGTGAVSTAL